MKKRAVIIAIFVVMLLSGVAYAAFADKAEILGVSVTVGSANVKLLDDLAGGVGSENLVDSKPGPVFESISPGWVEDYMLSIFNNGTSDMQLSTFADYETINDPDDLRQIIFVEPFPWNDANTNGLVDLGEMGSSYGRNTVVKWKTHGYNLEVLPSGGVKSYVFRFSTESIPDSKQGATGVFSFEIDATEIE